MSLKKSGGTIEMRSLLSIVGRNLKVISRSKLSSFLVLLAPILIVFLVGTAFSSDSLNNIVVGVYSPEYGQLTEDLISSLSDENVNTKKVESEEDCINSIKQGRVHICLIFLKEIDLEKGEGEIQIHVDNSRINLAYSLVNKIDSKISIKSSELGLAVAEDLLRVLKEIKDYLPEQKAKINFVVSDIGSIESEVSSISGVSLGSLVLDLESAITKIDAMESNSNLSKIRSEISSVKSELEDLDSDLGESVETLSEKTTSGKLELEKISQNIEVLIQNISLISPRNAESVVTPIKTEVIPLSKDSSNWKYLFPTLTTLIILLSSVVLSSSIVLTERRARAKFRNFMTPTSDLSFIFGAYVTSFIILALQLILLFIGTFYLTHLNVLEFGASILLVIFISSSVFITVGMLIGYLFKSDETTILASISIASLFIFFSNAIIPVELIRGNLKYLAIYNPFFITDSILKKILLFGEPLLSYYFELLILTGIFILLIIFTLIARKMTKRMA
jgi:ABC-type multidrug transport system permease subunit